MTDRRSPAPPARVPDPVRLRDMRRRVLDHQLLRLGLRAQEDGPAGRDAVARIARLRATRGDVTRH